MANIGVIPLKRRDGKSCLGTQQHWFFLKLLGFETSKNEDIVIVTVDNFFEDGTEARPAIDLTTRLGRANFAIDIVNGKALTDTTKVKLPVQVKVGDKWEQREEIKWGYPLIRTLNNCPADVIFPTLRLPDDFKLSCLVLTPAKKFNKQERPKVELED